MAFNQLMLYVVIAAMFMSAGVIIYTSVDGDG